MPETPTGSTHAGAPALRLRGITKRFPGVVANDSVDFEVAAGEVHALLGENGAGKSTLSSILTGLYQPDAGELELDGERTQFRGPREALEAGIGMVHQHFRLVPTLTVAENVVLGDNAVPLLLRPRAIEAQVAELAARYGLDVDPGARVWQLSVGEQQRVEILKALYRRARILILDEPTAVLTPQEADALFRTLRSMVDEGRTVIFISHKLREVELVADRVTVLRGGRVVGTARVADTTAAELAKLMVGEELPLRPPRESGVPVGEALLAVDGLWVGGDRGVAAVRGVTLSVGAGEVVAVAGVAGNGQRELAEAIAGMRAPAEGEVRIAGRKLRAGDARDAIRAGVAYVPEDRLGTGVAAGLSVSANLVLKRYRSSELSRGPLLSRRRVRAFARALMERYHVRAAGPETPVRQLSGGNVQRVVIGREFSAEPRVLVAASPTRGLDVAAIDAVHGYIREASAAGLAVLLISEDLDEILALADRIAVLFEGAVAGELDAGSATPEALGLLMAGGGA